MLQYCNIMGCNFGMKRYGYATANPENRKIKAENRKHPSRSFLWEKIYLLEHVSVRGVLEEPRELRVRAGLLKVSTTHKEEAQRRANKRRTGKRSWEGGTWYYM